MKHVLLLHMDGKVPNLALMKLAAFHRAQGDRVELRRISVTWWDDDSLAKAMENLEPYFGDPAWDLVYGSLIFSWSRVLAERARVIYPQIQLGGTGWDFASDGTQLQRTDLPPEAAAMAPDYSDYRSPSETYSLGFTQRGCRLSCGFCVVPRKEGGIKMASTLAEIWRGDPWPRHIMLLDNDFFGGPRWKEIVAEAIAGGFKISLIQGINARLLNEETAAALASMKMRDDSFSRTRIYTAWDGRKDEKRLFRGLEALKRHGIAPDSVLVYMLVGHEPGETHADRDYRRAKLRAFGARPYPMPFVRDGELGEELRAFSRFCVQRVDLHKTWEEFWGKAHGNPRKLGDRRVSLPLFEDE